MIERDRLIINGLRDVDRCYGRILKVIANAAAGTNDPIGEALTIDEQLGLSYRLSVLSDALAERVQQPPDGVEGSVEQRELPPGR